MSHRQLIPTMTPLLVPLHPAASYLSDPCGWKMRSVLFFPHHSRRSSSFFESPGSDNLWIPDPWCFSPVSRAVDVASSHHSPPLSLGPETTYALLCMCQGGQASQLRWPWRSGSALLFLYSLQMENLPPGWELCFDLCQCRRPYYVDHSMTSAAWTQTCPLVNPAVIAPHTHAPTQVAKEILIPNTTNACGTYADVGLPLGWEKLGMPSAKPAVDRSVARPCVIYLMYAHSIYSAPCPEVVRRVRTDAPCLAHVFIASMP